VKGLTSKYF